MACPVQAELYATDSGKQTGNFQAPTAPHQTGFPQALVYEKQTKLRGGSEITALASHANAKINTSERVCSCPAFQINLQTGSASFSTGFGGRTVPNWARPPMQGPGCGPRRNRSRIPAS